MPLDVLIDGSLSGTYTLAPPNELDFRAAPGDQITITATLADAPLLNASLGDLVPMFGGSSSVGAGGTYSCRGSTFEYTPRVSVAAPNVFQRTGG